MLRGPDELNWISYRPTYTKMSQQDKILIAFHVLPPSNTHAGAFVSSKKMFLLFSFFFIQSANSFHTYGVCILEKSPIGLNFYIQPSLVIQRQTWKGLFRQAHFFSVLKCDYTVCHDWKNIFQIMFFTIKECYFHLKRVYER